MKPTPSKSLLTIGLLAASLLPAAAAEPNADELLRQMSAKLAAARSFSFEATREIDPALLEGRDLPEKARIAVAVQRPNKLAGQAKSKAGVRRFVFDGSTLALLDEKSNHYATVPMRTSLDGLVAALDEKYGFTPPLAEFALSDPYADFHQQADTVTYLGRAKTSGGFLGLGGVECHRLALKGKVADAELWIAVSDQLPRKLVATFHRAGQPQVRIAFSMWNLAAPITAADFTFTPPKGAEKIEMWTTARMASASKKTAARKN
jgi:hypothetical protein